MKHERFEVQVKLIVRAEDEDDAHDIVKKLICAGIDSLIDDNQEPVEDFDIEDVTPAEVY